jgi:Flp pilus assembly protein TadB
MNRRVLQRVILSFVCALSLALIPMSYSWAQSSTTGNQQDQTQTDRNADRQNQDVNQDMNQRQKPASEPNNTQNQSQTQSQTSEQQAGKSREGLPATAGELPLLALIGVLSLAAAGSTRLFARAKSTR